MFVLYDIWVFLSPIDRNNFCHKIFKHYIHFFVLKREKQTLCCIHTKFEGNENNSFSFSNLFCGGTLPAPPPPPPPLKIENTENCLDLRGSGMPIFRYFPFFLLFLARSVLHRSVSRFLFSLFSPISSLFF